MASFSGHKLAIEADWTSIAPEIGDSIAVNGVCQTLEQLVGHKAVFHVLDETRNVTNFKFLKPGDVVNLEGALKLGERLGGHIVQGHVDCTGTLLKITRVEDDLQLTIRRPAPDAFPIIHKGSVAVNGISLTVAALTDSDFSVRIIPATWNRTNLNLAKPGDEINLEADVMGKYAKALLTPYAPSQTTITMKQLIDAGF